MPALQGRKTWIAISMTAVGFAVAGATVAGATTSAPQATPPGHFASGTVLVHYAAGVSQARQSTLEHGLGATRVSELSDLGVVVLRLPAGAETHAVAALQRSGLVRYAERDAVATTTDVTPNDYWWPGEWAPVKVHAPTAWTTTTGTSSVTVAVLDTGLTQSSDLQGNIVAGYNMVGGSTDTTDDNGHGTMAASVIGAQSNNSIGVASFCWHCSLMPVKVMDSTGNGTYSNIANGITWATDHGAKVISMSLSGTTDSSTLHSAVQYAHSHGVVLAAAAGNNSCNCTSYPAAYAEVLGVAATDSTDALTSYSNYGSWVKVAAPGTNWAVTSSGTYGQYAGTSSATPVVAGIAGLLLSSSSTVTNTQVEAALESSAVKISGVQYGRVDAAGALTALGSGSTTSPAPSPSPSPSPTTTTTTYTGSLSSKAPSKTFSQSLAAGSVQASLSFTKASSLTLTLQAPDGTVVASSSAGNPVQVSSSVAAGTYTWVVSGATRASFTLTVTATS